MNDSESKKFLKIAEAFRQGVISGLNKPFKGFTSETWAMINRSAKIIVDNEDEEE